VLIDGHQKRGLDLLQRPDFGLWHRASRRSAATGFSEGGLTPYVIDNITGLLWRIPLCGVQQDFAAVLGAALCWTPHNIICATVSEGTPSTLYPCARAFSTCRF